MVPPLLVSGQIGCSRTELDMDRFARLAIPAAVAIAAAAFGLAVFGCGTPGGPPSASPSRSPSPSPSTSPSVSAVAPPALTGTFTSTMHGISISYPDGWIPRAATEPWATGLPTFGAAFSDVIYDATLEDHLFLNLASQPLGGDTGEQWADRALNAPEWEDTCDPPIESVSIGGGPGRVVVHCGGSLTAATWAGERAYQIILYTSTENPELDAAFDRDWFLEVLATVQLHPEDAIDAVPSASP
jgi:hypothetical protein